MDAKLIDPHIHPCPRMEKSPKQFYTAISLKKEKNLKIFFSPLKTLRTFEEMAEYKAESAARLLQQNNLQLLEAVVEGSMEEVKRSAC
jgi:hypothetical protein